MKKTLALLLSLVLVVGLLAGCGGGTTPESKAPESNAPESNAPESNAPEGPTFEPQTWKFSCSATETSTWADAGRYFGELMSEATGGAITVEIYAADQLSSGSQTDGIQMVMDGTTEISMHSNLIYSGFDKRFNVVSLPFLFSSTEDADAKLDGAGGEALQGVLAEYGLQCLGIAENGFRHPTNSQRPIATVEDMKGLKLRVAGSALLNREYELWGANYANANWSEVFTALQTGTYDGQENPLPTADAASIAEVQKYVTYWTGTYDCLFFCMNAELYNSLSPELQALVDENGQKAVEYQRQINRDQDEAILEAWEAAGVTVTRLSDEAAEEFKAAAAPCYEEFAEELTPELIAAFTGN